MIQFADSDKQIAQDLKQQLLRITQLTDLRVFGSRARGTADNDLSDLDVFIEVPQLTPQLKKEILETAWEVGFKHFIVISPLIFTQDEIENSPLRASSIVRTILAEGMHV